MYSQIHSLEYLWKQKSWMELLGHKINGWAGDNSKHQISPGIVYPNVLLGYVCLQGFLPRYPAVGYSWHRCNDCFPLPIFPVWFYFLVEFWGTFLFIYFFFLEISKYPYILKFDMFEALWSFLTESKAHFWQELRDVRYPRDKNSCKQIVLRNLWYNKFFFKKLKRWKVKDTRIRDQWDFFFFLFAPEADGAYFLSISYTIGDGSEFVFRGV